MNPPGDGLCYFHCIVEAINPGIRTKIERVRQAIAAQRKVIQYIEQKIKEGGSTTIEKYKTYMGWEESHTNIGLTTHKIRKQLEEMKKWPTRYMTDVVEIIQYEAAEALGVTIETHRVTKQRETYQDRVEIV